jgi:hypothetical protein
VQVYQSFRGLHCLHHKVDEWQRRYNAEDSHLHNRRREILKSQSSSCCKFHTKHVHYVWKTFCMLHGGTAVMLAALTRLTLRKSKNKISLSCLNNTLTLVHLVSIR